MKLKDTKPQGKEQRERHWSGGKGLKSSVMNCFEEHPNGNAHQPVGGMSLRLRKEMRSEM